MLATLAAASSTSAAITLPLLPTKSSAVLLPGQGWSVTFRDDREKAFFLQAEQSVIGQLLQLEGGECSLLVPMLRVCAVSDDTATLACIGRGQLQPPLRRTRLDSHSRADVLPIADRSLDCCSEAVPAVRALYHRCYRLAERAKRLPHVTQRTVEVARCFERPLEKRMRARRGRLVSAARARGEGGGIESAPTEDRRRPRSSLRTPWIEGELMRALWAPRAGESELQLLSFTTAALLPPAGRLAALSSRDAHSRLEQQLALLRDTERRLAVELSLSTLLAPPVRGPVGDEEEQHQEPEEA